MTARKGSDRVCCARQSEQGCASPWKHEFVTLGSWVQLARNLLPDEAQEDGFQALSVKILWVIMHDMELHSSLLAILN